MSPTTSTNTATTNSHMTWVSTASSLNLATNQSTTSINIISLKELGAIIDEFTASANGPTAPPTLSPPATMDTRYGVCLQIQVLGFNKNAKLFVKIRKFLIAAKQADYTITICPFQQDNPDKIPNINAEANLQNTRDLTKYFHPMGLNQVWSLSGLVYIESQFMSNVLLEHLLSWCKNGNHQVSPL